MELLHLHLLHIERLLAAPFCQSLPVATFAVFEQDVANVYAIIFSCNLSKIICFEYQAFL